MIFQKNRAKNRKRSSHEIVERIISNLRKIDWYFSKYILRRKVIRRKLRDMELYLDLETPGISKTFAVNRIREIDKTIVIKEFLKEKMVVLDCGSNIGFYPLLEASIVKEFGKVFAFEPDIRNYDLLLKNISISPYGEIIEPINMAVSEKSGKEQIIITAQSNLNKVSTGNDEEFLKRHSVEKNVDIACTTVDDFCRDRNIELDFVRMDIEGYEVAVFRGMEETLKSSKKGFKVLLELHPHLYSKDRSFAAELERLFHLNFKAKVIISAGEPRPKKFFDLGYSPLREVKADGFIHGWYENIKNEDVTELTCYQPKMSRYILLEKE